MTLFAIGDLHLSSQGKTMDIFGSRWKNHQNRLFEKWRQTVRPEDIVLVAGDTSWALKLEEAVVDLDRVGELPGTKILIRGNHDYWWSSRSKVNAILPEGMIAINANAWTRDGLAVVGTRGWAVPGTPRFDVNDQKIYRREVNRLRIALEQIPLNGIREIVTVLHYPPLTQGIPRSGFTELLESYHVSTCVYAHLHGEDQRLAFEGTRNGITFVFVACDYLDFQPVKIKL